jgi:hypothetical protein
MTSPSLVRWRSLRSDELENLTAAVEAACGGDLGRLNPTEVNF